MGLGLAHLRLTGQMRCLRFYQSTNSPLRIPPYSEWIFIVISAEINLVKRCHGLSCANRNIKLAVNYADVLGLKFFIDIDGYKRKRVAIPIKHSEVGVILTADVGRLDQKRIYKYVVARRSLRG